jgi:glycosyltransferase involved in cell wall biosynthesis
MDIPVKVLQLVLSLTIGGAEKLVYDLVQYVDRQLVSPVICCLDALGQFGEALQRDGYSVYVLHRRPGLDWQIIPKLCALLEEEQVQVIHAHQFTPYFYGLLASRLFQMRHFPNRPKVLVTEHGRTYYPERKQVKRMLANPILSLLTDEIITISASTKATLVKCENYPAARVKIVYNGIDLQRFAPQQIDAITKRQSLGIAPDAKVIGTVGRLDPIKNHAMLLRAFRQVLQDMPDTYLVIVGEGPEAQRLTTLAQTLEIGEHTLFLGARHDVPELLHIFDVFVLSSLREGTSVSLLEAMGTGLAVVVTNVGGNPEVVVDQETGYLVPSDQEQEMAAKVITLLQDQEMRRKMGQAGQQRAYTMFSLDQMVKTYTDMYLNRA